MKRYEQAETTFLDVGYDPKTFAAPPPSDGAGWHLWMVRWPKVDERMATAYWQREVEGT